MLKSMTAEETMSSRPLQLERSVDPAMRAKFACRPCLCQAALPKFAPPASVSRKASPQALASVRTRRM